MSYLSLHMNVPAKLGLIITTLLIVLISGCTLNGKRPIPVKGQALFYAVTDYSGLNAAVSYLHFGNLAYTDDDAKSMERLFRENGYETRLRLNANATIAQLKLDIADISNRIGSDETFIFYFSGHGGQSNYLFNRNENEIGQEPEGNADAYDEWLFFYLPHSAPFNSWSDTAIFDDALRELIDTLPTHKKVIIIDACNSGGFIGNSYDFDSIPPNFQPPSGTFDGPYYFNSSPDYQTGTQANKRPKNLTLTIGAYFHHTPLSDADFRYDQGIVLTASGEQEVSYEDSLIGHGYFTLYFLETPLFSDLNGDNLISISEAYNYIVTKINQEVNPYLVGNLDTRYPQEGPFHPRISGGPVDFILFAAY